MKYWEIIADKLHAAGWSWGLLQRFDDPCLGISLATTQLA